MCVIGCNRPPGGGNFASSFRTLCSAHGDRDRRHGDPLQEGVRAPELAPYICALRSRQKLRPDALAWSALERRWEGLVRACRDVATLYERGKPGNKWEVEASQEIIKVAEQASAEEAWMVAVGMVMLREAEPRRFQSERSFRVQLGRRTRLLALTNKATYWCPKRGRFKGVYRDPSPRAAVLVGDMLAEVFAVAGLYFHQEDKAEAAAKAAEREAFYAALRDVAPNGGVLL